jgi:hypothetical protein
MSWKLRVSSLHPFPTGFCCPLQIRNSRFDVFDFDGFDSVIRDALGGRSKELGSVEGGGRMIVH